MDNVVAVAALTLAGTIATGFFAIINQQNKTHAKLSQSMDKVAASNQAIAKETRRGNEEAKQRNGHLAELTIQSGEQMLEAIQSLKKQNVKEQTVEHQTVKSKE